MNSNTLNLKNMKTLKKFILYYIISFIATLFGYGFFWLVNNHILRGDYKFNYISILVVLFIIMPFFIYFKTEKK
jgi:apolipoprotein N-acyltransferase